MSMTDEGRVSSEQKASLWNSFNRLLELVKTGYSPKADSANVFLEKVSTELVDVCQFLSELDESDQVECANEIGDSPNFVSVLVSFMAGVYKALSNGHELKCLCYWQLFLRMLARASQKFRLKVVKENIHFEVIKQLIDPPKSSEHQEIVAHFIKMALHFMLILIQDEKIRRYFNNCYYVDILVMLSGKNLPFIVNAIKISLAILYRQLDHSQIARSISFTPLDVSIVLKILSNQKLSRDEEKESWHILSKNGLIQALRGFCSLKDNCIQFVKQGGLKVLSTILDGKKADDLEVSLLLLWQLSHFVRPEIMAYDFVEKIHQLSIDEGNSLFDLKTSVSLCFLCTLPEGDEDCLRYIEAAYRHEFYEECVRFCEEVAMKFSSYEASTIDKITLFHGKASYYIFKQKLLAVKKIPKNDPKYFKEREMCLKDAKQAISLLGRALDKNAIDDEGSRLLDTVMMLALSESATLNRCLLCRSRQKKLIQSHICPHAVLRDFTEVCGGLKGGRPFLVNWPWQPGLSGNWKSAGEITVYLLCHNCELILGKNESLFLPNFFRKFYSKNEPSRIRIKQDIEYDKWLYQFLVGLIFRGLAFQFSGGRDEYLNEDEVYSIFMQCREALLHFRCDPQISLYIVPTTSPNELELSSSLINEIIHLPYQCFFTDMKCVFRDHQLSSHALSYMFRIGMIMATINFSPADWTVEESSIISPTKGVFHVLSDCDRRVAIPDALWESLLVRAIDLEKQMIEQPQRKKLPQIPPTSYMKDVWDTAKSPDGREIKKSFLQFHPKIVNYIPSTIAISHYQEFNNPTGNLKLPSEHKVLLHLTIPRGDSEVGNTVFIVAGEGPGYDDNPYLIFHQYEPGLQINYGFFFSPSTFEFDHHLPDRTPKKNLDRGLEESGLKGKSKALISLVLKTKGFRNYHSLQYWTHAIRTPSVLDTKCRFENNSKCWYCYELCEICLKPTILGPSCTDSSNKILQFCSEECCDLYKQKPEPKSTIFSPDKQENPDKKVPVGHKEYLHLFSCGKLDNGSPGFILRMSLCEGDGSSTFPMQQYYLNYSLRMPLYQCYYEFFITDNFQALDSVSYSGTSCSLFKQHDEKAIKQKALGIVSDVIRGFGGSGVCDFLEKIKLYDLIGASLVISGDKKDDSATAVEGDPARTSCAVKSGQALKKDEPQKTELAISPHQLQVMLNECGGDYSKIVEMVQDLMENQPLSKKNGSPAVNQSEAKPGV